MNKSFDYIPKDKRKKIVLICDDIRVHSGVATVAREIVTHTCHHFNWVNIGGAINHPDQGKKLDLSADSNQISGIDDSYVMMYPTNGYGDVDFLRQIIKLEKPDAIMLITDPRYFVWLFNIEQEIRKKWRGGVSLKERGQRIRGTIDARRTRARSRWLTIVAEKPFGP